MVREIVRDERFLSLPSQDAAEDDALVIRDLEDTLRANRNVCVGMAANMIGVRKNIIIVACGPMPVVMVNPAVVKKSGEYVTKEGCLSLDGERECVRYHEIEVVYLDSSFNKRRGKFSGFLAEIIQHEIDHLRGIVI